jgi:hypothetical protein|tara:strand:- start:6698 stop:6961 length:264 start_codon:yes stop_codon:yes gene_type:complete
MANAAKKITEAELLEVQSMNNAFNQLKLKIADTVLTKEHLLGEVAKLKEEYKSVEEKLTEKYGQDAVIDIQTGDISEKEKEKLEKVE